MNYSAKAYPVLICLISAMATPALAQQPPDPVQSDSLANTAMGTNALLNVNLDESGCHNTASGDNALYSDTSGSYNTATGFSSLLSNTTGNNNTAAGYESLYLNSTGSNNTASGYQALYTNATGANNTASGYQALYSNTTGNANAAYGSSALYANTVGYNNTAIGLQVLQANTTGYGNAAQGAYALGNNTTGYRNTAVGNKALNTNYSGWYNTALGYQGGSNITGSYNIDIGNVGVTGESNTIRIGATSQIPGDSSANVAQATYIAGISGTIVTGAAVYVTSDGQLGVLASSERYKTDIKPIGTTSEKLSKLRPVSFHLKTDPHGAVQYGLIAEEVDKVYPELVIRDDSGKIQGVHYEELAPMLLNELQQQQATIKLQAAEIRDLNQQQQNQLTAQTEHAAAQDAEIRDLKKLVIEMRAGLLKLQSKDVLVAQR